VRANHIRGAFCCPTVLPRKMHEILRDLRYIPLEQQSCLNLEWVGQVRTNLDSACLQGNRAAMSQLFPLPN
jgi:hypothetical protein